MGAGLVTEKQWGVVFQTGDGALHQLFVPPGFGYTTRDGGILIFQENSQVTGIVGAQPLLRGEADEPDSEVGQGGADPDLEGGHGGPDDGGFLEDPPQHDRAGE